MINSKISTHFANIFLKFSKSKVPTKLFTAENEAKKWLKEQLVKQQPTDNAKTRQRKIQFLKN